MGEPHPDQSRDFAHLRQLHHCRDCNAPATEELYSGLNAPVGTYCSRHAKAALKRFRERTPLAAQPSQPEEK
jgi:hypothetical protein